MTGPLEGPFIIEGDEYFKLKASGTMVNMSELVRIYRAVNDRIKPGMDEDRINQIISETVKRMSPN